LKSRSSSGSVALGVLLLADVVGCKPKAGTVGDDTFQAADECGQAAEIFFTLRAAAGDYDRAEADRRAKQSLDDLHGSCKPDSPVQTCCAAALRLRTLVEKGHLANCDDFQTMLRAGGCSNL